MGCLLGSAVVQLCDPGQTTHSLGLTFSLVRMDVEHKYVSIRNELGQVTLPGGSQRRLHRGGDIWSRL